MNSKILILVLTLCFTSLVLSVDPAFITVYIHKDVQTMNANSELKGVSDKLGSITEFDKQDIVVNSVTYKINEVSVVAKKQDANSVLIGNSYTEQDKQLSTTYNIKANTLTLEFIVKLEKGTFSTTFSNKAIDFVLNYEKFGADYALKFSKLSLEFDQADSVCKVDDVKLQDADCKEFFTKFLANNASKINETSQAAIEEGVQSNIPTNKKIEDTRIISREDSNVSIVFNTKPTTNPYLLKNTDGEAVIFKINGNVALYTAGSQPTFDALETATPDFDNFIVINGKNQYSIKQEIVNKAYSLVRPKNANTFAGVSDLSVYSISRVFPEITRNYARSANFELIQKTTDFNYSSKRPVFTGTLKIKLPKIQDIAAVEIDITYEYIPDIVSLAAVEENNVDFFNLELINVNSFIRYLVVSNNAGITDEFELRKWLTPVLSAIYDQPIHKSPFSDKTKVEVIFKNYKNLETYYNGAFIFSMIDQASNVETKQVKELLFLGQ